MEGFNQLVGAISKFAQPIQAGIGLMGLVNQMSMASKEKAALDRSIYYSKHPEAISAIAAKLQKPLSTGLTQGVENVVNASMAEQGLSQAPGIQSQVLGQALAPYQQREQEMALTAALQAIGLPSEALASMRGMKDPNQTASLMKLLLPQNSGQGSDNVTSGIDINSIPSTPLPTDIYGITPPQPDYTGMG